MAVIKREMVGARGFEPPTSCSRSRRATRLRYAPTLGPFGTNGPQLKLTFLVKQGKNPSLWEPVQGLSTLWRRL